MGSPPKLVCAGHSHLSAVMRAYRDEFAHEDWNFTVSPMRLQIETLEPNIVTENGVRRLNPEVVKRMRHVLRRQEPDAVAGFFMGNEVNAMTLVQHPRPFDFHWPEMELPVAEGAEIIPFGLIKEQMRHASTQNAELLIQGLREVYDGRFCILPPPPPNPSEKHIRAHPGRFGKLVRRHGISPAPLRLKMWMLYCQVLREEAPRAGAEVFDIPAQAFDANGFLDAAYWNPDPTHGNQAYGRLILTYLLDQIFSLSPERIPA